MKLPLIVLVVLATLVAPPAPFTLATPSVDIPCPGKPPCTCRVIEDHKDPNVAHIQSLSCPGDKFPELRDRVNETFYDVALRIENSGFKTVPKGALQHLSARPIVQISRNPNLETIEAGGLFMHRVALLTIRDNPNLKTIQAGAFNLDGGSKGAKAPLNATVTRMRTLVIIADEISQLPDGVFDGLDDFGGLVVLQLDGLQELKKGSLKGLSSVRQLELRTGHVTGHSRLVLKEGAFSGMFRDNVQCEHQCCKDPPSVRISGASAIQNGTFLNCSGLQFLSLNSILKADPGSLNGLASLKQLELNNEQLNLELPRKSRTALFRQFFAGVPKLESLSLAKISKQFLFGDNVFERLASLKSLSLSDLSLASIPSSLGNLHNLSSLSITNVPLTQRGMLMFLHHTSSKLSALESLSTYGIPFNQSMIASLSGVNHPYLTRLSLRCGEFESVPENVTSFPCLSQLAITNCLEEQRGESDLREFMPCDWAANDPCVLKGWAQFNLNGVELHPVCRRRKQEDQTVSVWQTFAKQCPEVPAKTLVPYCSRPSSGSKECEAAP